MPAELKAKYGKPSELHTERLQTVFGAKFIGYSARWKLPGVSVDFDGTSGGIYWGRVEISTVRYKALMEEQTRKDVRLRPRLREFRVSPFSPSRI